MTRGTLIFLLLALASCATPSPPPPAISDHPSAAPGSTPLFEFRTGFWVSLHHHLRGEARRLPFALKGKLAKNPDPATLPADERAAWEAGLAVYGKKMAPRDLLFDGEMVKIKNALADLGDAADLSALRGRFDAESLDALERAAPVYRSHLWPEHKRLAKAWIAGMTPLVERYGPAIARRLAALYGATWTESIPVEVLPEAGPVDAYTSANPTRISISDQNPRLVGLAALEILFHESSHGWDGELEHPLAEEAARRGVTIPDTLWHAVLFYVAGVVVRDELERSGEPGYVLYVDANHLWDHGWQGLREPIAASCDPWLRGERSREAALNDLVEAVGKPRSEGG
jgi:nucleotide-binding universal stress UspA family protein